jgi:hypothetical protein
LATTCGKEEKKMTQTKDVLSKDTAFNFFSPPSQQMLVLQSSDLVELMQRV